MSDHERAAPVSLDPAEPIHPALVECLAAAQVRLTSDQIVEGCVQLRELATHPAQPPEVARLFRAYVRLLLAEQRRRDRLLARLDPDPDESG